MSIVLGAFFFLALLVGLAASGIAIAKPRLRAAAAIIACFGFFGAAACAGIFMLVVSRMN